MLSKEADPQPPPKKLVFNLGPLETLVSLNTEGLKATSAFPLHLKSLRQGLVTVDGLLFILYILMHIYLLKHIKHTHFTFGL